VVLFSAQFNRLARGCVLRGGSQHQRYALEGDTVRYFKSVSTLVGLFSVFAICAQAAQPTITVAYNKTFDSVCSFLQGYEIKDEWKIELDTRQKEFENLWTAAGPKLLETTEKITKKPFPEKNFTARLTLCNLPSQSYFGIGINMRYALKSFTTTPVPMSYKVNTLFHELLHSYFAENPIENSVLLKQHASEPERTRNHLHLLALQKAVFLKLNETEMLKDQIAIDSQLPDGYYKRAWEIVNATDTEYLKYVSEISSMGMQATVVENKRN
jgi:hypothetical protein